MPYTPKTWENKPSTASPINATNLNHMEGGIKTNDDNIVGAQNAILTLQGEMLQAQGDISALETLVDSIFPVDTESGNPAVITDAFGGACKSLKLILEPIQSGSGTPSPQNVRSISGRTQSVIYHYDKNLFNASTIVRRYASNPQTRLETGSIVKVNNGDKIVFSTDYAGIQFGVIFFNDANKTTNIGDSGWLNPNTAYTIQHDGFICLGSIGIRNSNDSAFSDADIANLKNAHTQLEIGSTATTYEPYNGESITRTYGTTIYGGSDDVTGEGATVTYGFVTYDGSDDESWTMYGSGSASAYALVGHLPSSAVFTPNVLGVLNTNYLENISAQATWGNYDYFISQSNAMTGADFVIGLKNISTSVNALKAYLAEHPLTVCYKLATFTSIPLTAQNITLLHGDNILTTDADSIEASYSADIALYIAKKIAEGSQGNRSLSKGGSSESTEEAKEEEKKEEEKEEIEIKETEPLTKEVR